MNIQHISLKLPLYLILICFSLIINISCSGDKKSEQEILFKKHYDKGSDYLKKGNSEGAIKEFNEAVNVNPNSADALFKLGRIYHDQRKFKESAEAYERALEINPDGTYQDYFYLAVNYTNIQKYDNAIEAMKRAEKLMTDENFETEYGLNFILAKSYYHKNDYENAIKYFNRVQQLEPSFPNNYVFLSNCYTYTGKHKEAKDILEQGLKQQPNSIAIIEALSWLLSTSKSNKIRDGNRSFILAERAVDFTDGKNHNHLDTLAAAYAELGKFDDAVKSQENAIKVATDPTITTSLDETKITEYKDRLALYRIKKPWRE